MKDKFLKIATLIFILSLGVITACGEPSHTHNFNKLKYDETSHWYECDCGEQASSKEEHSGGTATCKNKAICEVCGAKYGQLSNHSYSSKWLSNGTTHYKKATCGCDIDNVEENHVDNGNGICSICDVIFVATEGLKFEISNEQTYAMVIGYEGQEKNVVIPNYYNDLPVTVINEGALYQNTVIESMLMPNTVISIGERAFAGCTSLQDIAFNGENANYTTIDGSLYSKDKTTLIQCAIGKTNKEFDMPNYVTSIGNYAFAFDSYSTLFNFNNVTSIGKYAFKGCYFYSGIQLSPNSTVINEYAFSEVEWLTEVKIPSMVKTIESNAFLKCSRLRKVTFNSDSNLQTISEYAFSETSLHDGITLPSSLVSIGNYAFMKCKYLSNIIIPKNVELIGYYAFSQCESLKTVTFEDDCNVKFLDMHTFSVCNKLETVNFGENSKLEELGERVFYACGSLKYITLPTTLTTIGASAFHFCQSLEEIYIPISVKYMAVNVFYNCHWTTIYCQAESQPEDWSVVWNPSNCTVYWGC